MFEITYISEGLFLSSFIRIDKVLSISEHKSIYFLALQGANGFIQLTKDSYDSLLSILKTEYGDYE